MLYFENSMFIIISNPQYKKSPKVCTYNCRISNWSTIEQKFVDFRGDVQINTSLKSDQIQYVTSINFLRNEK